jgi:hypothetical protein
MINPAQYQQVLQKMPDQALMQLLKRPDKIPSQFVVQEINRRKQMRQGEQARKQQVANAVAMQQQQPVQTTTPEGQPAIGMQSGGSGRLNPQGFFARPTSEIFADIFSGPIFGRRDSGKDKDIYEDNPMLSYKGSAKSNLDKTKNVFGRTMPDLVRASYMTGKGQYNPNFPSEKVMGIDTLRPPEDENLIDADDIGLKDQSIAKTVDEINPDPKLVEKMDVTPNNFFANSLESINKQIKETNNKFGVEQLQKGRDGLLQFNELDTAFQNLEDKGKKRVTDFNADSKALLDERKKLIANLESGGRSPSSIVYESLINMGLNLMASPEANFTQALGKAGQAGFATFQNLRKEEKERVKDMHKMSYDLAVKEFEHKQKADEIQNAYDLKVLDGKSVLLNAQLQMAEQERKGQKTAADIGYMGEQVRQGDLKLALQSAQNDIQMFNANINKFKAENDAIYKNNLSDTERYKVDANKSIFNRIFDVESKNPDNKDESDILNSTITRYALTQADSVKDENVKKDLIEKAIPTLFKDFNADIAKDDPEYTRNFIMQANKIIDSLVKAEGGLTITEKKLDEILAKYGQ